MSTQQYHRVLFVILALAIGATAYQGYRIRGEIVPDLTEAKQSIEKRFSPQARPLALEIRKAIEATKQPTDDQLLRWFSQVQVLADADRREACLLFAGIAIDWPSQWVIAHESTLAHVSGEMLATWNGDEAIAWAGLSMACEIDAVRDVSGLSPKEAAVAYRKSRDLVKSLADGVDKEAKGAAWRSLYHDAYTR